MRLGPLILIAFIAIPIAEIWILIEVGGIIGVVPTIAAVVLTAIAGTALIRHQGMDLIAKARQQLDRGEPPVGAVVDGVFLLVAGALLLTPGFITDAVGFLCLVPLFRRGLAAWLWSRYGNRVDIRQTGFAGSGDGPEDRGFTGTIIEGEFTEVDGGEKIEEGSDEETGEETGAKKPNGQSPWADGPPRR